MVNFVSSTLCPPYSDPFKRYDRVEVFGLFWQFVANSSSSLGWWHNVAVGWIVWCLELVV